MDSKIKEMMLSFWNCLYFYVVGQYHILGLILSFPIWLAFESVRDMLTEIGFEKDISYDFIPISASNGNTGVKLSNNNLDTDRMKRQSSLGGPAQSPPSRTERTGSEGGGGPGEAAMSLSMSPVSSSVTPLSTPLHSSVTHSGPASPFRLMREGSVDGTLSPVSFKGGMDTLDNDTSGRRKVRIGIP